ncbi:MFS transporter [Acidocella sp.]|uniref:MFS transporter n=1 Tax=Acidocella sp. TaxID=50710 RepID=UPI003D0143A3
MAGKIVLFGSSLLDCAPQGGLFAMAVGGGDSRRGNTAQILSIVVFNAVTYFLIGLPLAVFPGLVHFTLGYSAALAGIVISLQYAATLLTRSVVGRISDVRGAKVTVLAGLICAGLNGVCIMGGALCHAPLAVLSWLLLSRLFLGAAESGTGTGCITWGIGRLGGAATAEVISWNGVSSYGGIAAGAPAGVALMHWGGLPALAGVAMILPLLGLVGAAFNKAAAPLVGAKRMSMLSVAREIVPYGLALAGGSFGFGVIVAFMALYYTAHGWQGAAYALTSFGLCFVSVRIFLAGAIGRFGGFRAALVSFAIEVAGLVLLWLAPAPLVALLGAALAGFGFSLVFPALAVEALRTVAPGSRGAAIAIYTVFLDVALGVTGPLAGAVGGHFGYPAVFLTGALIVAAALALTFRLRTLVLARGV